MSDLETPAVESYINSSADKQVNKRRSSVFKRHSIVPPDRADLEQTNVTEEISQESKRFKFQNELEVFNIRKYIDHLTEEDKKWREEYAKRKSRTQDLAKRDKNKEHKQKLDITCLSDSDRAFLAAKPDYEQFNKNLFQLHTMATKVTYFNMCAEHFCERSMVKLQNDTDDAVRRIINLVD